jgi:hypothetical protein
LVGHQNVIAKILTIDWFDAKIQVLEEGIGTNHQNVGELSITNISHANFLEIN